MKRKYLIFLLVMSVILISITWVSVTQVRSKTAYSCTETPQTKKGESLVSVYFDPEWDEDTSLISCEVATLTNIIVVTTSERLNELVESNQEVIAIYLTPEGVSEIDARWLQEQYENGILIVALNTQHSILGEKLNVIPQIEDIQIERLPDHFIYYSLYEYSGQDGETTIRQSADFRPDFESIHPIVERYALELRGEK